MIKNIILYENKVNLITLNYKSIKSLLYLIKSKKKYAEYIFKWIHKYKITNIMLMTNISKFLRFKLSTICDIHLIKIINERISIDNTVKWLFKINNNYIETIAISNKKKKFTLCISSQIGCMLNCSFCYTAKYGFFKNLTTQNIISQIFIAENRLVKLFPKNNNITNIVIMGMGEPLLNTKNIITSLEIINNKYAYNISKKKITLSTSGIIPEFKTLMKHKIPIAISLHATNNKLRSELMPINRKYNIESLLTECKKYCNDNRITIEYILIKNINDTKEHALKLLKLLKNIKCKVCLIPFNSFNNSIYISSNIKNIINFQSILKKSNIITTIRKSKGSNIDAACGQLSENSKNKIIKSKYFINAL